MRYYVDPKLLPVLKQHEAERAARLFAAGADTAMIARFMNLPEAAVANSLHRMREKNHRLIKKGEVA